MTTIRAALIAAALQVCAAAALAQEPTPADSAATDSAAVTDSAATNSPATHRDHTSAFDTIVGSARHVVFGFTSDAWASVAAPFRLDRAEAWQVGGALTLTALLFAFDQQIQDAVVRNRDEPILEAIEETGLFLEPVSLMGNTNIYWAGGMVIGHLTGQDRIRHVFEELLFSHWIASLTRKGIGRPIGRLRPEESPDDPYDRIYWDGTSFPSGHASTAAQVATVLAHHIDWWPADVALLGLAGTVVYQRVAVDKHWASDSVLGALWGFGVARLVISRREADRTDFVPFWDPGAGAVGVRVATPF